MLKSIVWSTGIGILRESLIDNRLTIPFSKVYGLRTVERIFEILLEMHKKPYKQGRKREERILDFVFWRIKGIVP